MALVPQVRQALLRVLSRYRRPSGHALTPPPEAARGPVHARFPRTSILWSHILVDVLFIIMLVIGGLMLVTASVAR